jgi:serine/threonine-protein kinase HipA
VEIVLVLCLYLKMNGAPSSHILKTPIKDLHGTVENETFCMMLAKRMGLVVPDVKIFKMNEIPLYVIDRYDRKIENGQIIRLIQEDFCQALNVNAQLKYSPTLGMCFSLIRNESAFQVKDTKRFLPITANAGWIKISLYNLYSNKQLLINHLSFYKVYESTK